MRALLIHPLVVLALILSGILRPVSVAAALNPESLALTPEQEYSFAGGLPLLSADGKLVAFSRENQIIVQDLGSRKTVLEADLGSPPTAFAFSNDGQWLAVSSRGTRLWHIPTKRMSGEWKFAGRVLAFSPDDSRLVVAAYRGILLIDRTSGREFGPYHIDLDLRATTLVQALAFTPDGKGLFAATQEQLIHRFETSNFARAGEPWLNMGQVASMAFSRDGRRLAVGRAVANDTTQVVVLDSRTGGHIGEPMTGQTRIKEIVFTSDGRHLLTVDADSVTLWDSVTSERLGQVKPPRFGNVRNTSFARDLKRLFACDMGTYVQTNCRTWDVAINAPARAPEAGTARAAAAVAVPTGNDVAELSVDLLARRIDQSNSVLDLSAAKEPLVFANRGTLRFADDASASALRVTPSAAFFEHVAISPDGQHITVELHDKQLAVFEVKTGKLLTVMELNEYEVAHTFASDGTLALDAGREGVMIVNPVDGSPLRAMRNPAQGRVVALAASPKAPWLVLGTSEGSLAFGRIDKPSEGFRAGERVHNGEVVCIAISPDGRLVASGGVDGRVQMFDAGTGDRIGAPWEAHARAVTAIGFTPNGSLVASGGADGTLRVWDAQTGRALTLMLAGHTGPVLGVAFDTVRGRLLSFGRDSKLKRWNIASLLGVDPGETPQSPAPQAESVAPPPAPQAKSPAPREVRTRSYMGEIIDDLKRAYAIGPVEGASVVGLILGALFAWLISSVARRTIVPALVLPVIAVALLAAIRLLGLLEASAIGLTVWYTSMFALPGFVAGFWATLFARSLIRRARGPRSA